MKTGLAREQAIAEKVTKYLQLDEIYDPETPDDPAGSAIRFFLSKSGGATLTPLLLKSTPEQAKEPRKIAVVNLLEHWGNATLQVRIIDKVKKCGATDEDIENLNNTLTRQASLKHQAQHQAVLPLKYLPVTYRADRNFLNTFPLAVLGKPQPGQTYVTYENKKAGIKTEAGSMYGVLTEFDFRVFHAIKAHTKRVTIDGRLALAGARFSQYDIAKYLNLKQSGWNWKRITQALNRVGGLQIKHNSFQARDGTQAIERLNVFWRAYTKQKDSEAVDNVFLWDPVIGVNLDNYFEVINGKVLGQLGDTAGRLYCYLLRAMGEKGTHQEAWESIADRLPLIAKHRPGKKRTFQKACEELKSKTGIACKMDGKGIVYFTNHQKKTKEDHQAETRAEVDSQVDWNKQVKTLTTEQNRVWAKLIKLGVGLNFANKLVKSTIRPEFIQEAIRKMEIKKVKNPTAYLKKVFPLSGPKPEGDY